MFTALICGLLAAAAPAPAPAAAPEARRVLVLDLEAVGVAPTDANAATRVVAAAAAEVEGVEVVAAADLRRLAALEAEKAAAGCSDESCLAEMAGALGAESVLFGSLSKLGATTTAVLSLYTSKDGRTQRSSVDVTGDLGVLAPELRARTRALLQPTAAAPTAAGEVAASVDEGGPTWWTVAAVGGGMALVGAGSAGACELVLGNPALVAGDSRNIVRGVGAAGLVAASLGVVVGVSGLVLGVMP